MFELGTDHFACRKTDHQIHDVFLYVAFEFAAFLLGLDQLNQADTLVNVRFGFIEDFQVLLVPQRQAATRVEDADTLAHIGENGFEFLRAMPASRSFDASCSSKFLRSVMS